jgi:hypothetical protein
MLLEDASPRHTAMDNLSDQHIDSLPKDAREDAYQQVGMVCAYRSLGLSEDEVAKKAKFRSVDDMYFRLKRWGLSGLLPLEEEAKKMPKTIRQRKARGSGPITELPSADNAAPLFREKLEELLRATEELKNRKEKLQGGLFFQSSMYREPIMLRREDWSDDEWRELSERYNLDTEDDRFLVTDGVTWGLGDGTSAPQDPLPALISSYLLAGGEPQLLVEALHPDPASAEWTKLKKRIEGRKGDDNLDGLKALAGQLAMLIRGKPYGSGAPPPGLSRHEFNLACCITDARKSQIPDEKIYEDLLRTFGLSKEQLSWATFRRLANLGLRWPWS